MSVCAESDSVNSILPFRVICQTQTSYIHTHTSPSSFVLHPITPLTSFPSLSPSPSSSSSSRSPVYATQLHALDALNTLANEYHVVLRCLARIGARHTLDAVSALIHARKAGLGLGLASGALAGSAPGGTNGGSQSGGNGTANGERKGRTRTRPRYTREQLHELRVRCSTLKQRLRYRNRERKSE